METKLHFQCRGVSMSPCEARLIFEDRVPSVMGWVKLKAIARRSPTENRLVGKESVELTDVSVGRTY
jgi:hypothetical protein